MKEQIKDRIITLDSSLLDSMKQMDEVKVKILFVFNEEHFEGLITIGDIQRAIINNIALKEPVSRILNNNKIYGYQSEGEEGVKEKMRRMRAEVMPILDDKGELELYLLQNEEEIFYRREDVKDLPKILKASIEGSNKICAYLNYPIKDGDVVDEIVYCSQGADAYRRVNFIMDKVGLAGHGDLHGVTVDQHVVGGKHAFFQRK